MSMTTVEEERKQANRDRMAKVRAAKKAKPVKPVAPPATSKVDAPVAEFAGLTMTDCPLDCTPERCAIGGTVNTRKSDGTMIRQGICTHPAKGGLQSIHRQNQQIVARYNRARKHLAQMELDRKKD